MILKRSSSLANVAANDSALLGAILISAADMSAEGQLPRERVIAIMADNMEALAGVTPESMADDLITKRPDAQKPKDRLRIGTFGRNPTKKQLPWFAFPSL